MVYQERSVLTISPITSCEGGKVDQASQVYNNQIKPFFRSSRFRHVLRFKKTRPEVSQEQDHYSVLGLKAKATAVEVPAANDQNLT